MIVTDQQALLAAILANPADDAPRLIYADWLDEHGRTEYASLIRSQIAGQRHRSHKWTALAREIIGAETLSAFRLSAHSCGPNDNYGPKGLVVSGTKGPQLMIRTTGTIQWVRSSFDGTLISAERLRFYVRRGFVDSMEVVLNDLQDHYKLLFATHPLTKLNVRLSVGPVDTRCFVDAGRAAVGLSPLYPELKAASAFTKLGPPLTEGSA